MITDSRPPLLVSLSFFGNFERFADEAMNARLHKKIDELRQAVIEGAVHRLRPKLLTEGVAIIAIFSMVFAAGVGGEVLAPMALPVLGGLLISDEVVDLFLPVRFFWVRRARWLKLQKSASVFKV